MMQRAKFLDDPLVPLASDRLVAAAKAAKLTIRGLALKATLRQQTVDAMRRPKASGRSRRCRQSTRDKLASVSALTTYPPRLLTSYPPRGAGAA